MVGAGCSVGFEFWLMRKLSFICFTHLSNLKYFPDIQNEVNERELTALKAVIKCIEDHKLEAQYPLDPLQKRVLQLEKAKADKKRAPEVAKPLPKRPRANGVGHSPLVTNVTADKNIYARTTDR